MKKQLLFIAIALMAIVTSCDEKGGGDDVKKISLHSLNVADAKSIFKKTGEGTKSGSGEESYWKIDKSGKESKLVLSDANNTAQGDIEIKSLVKLSDEILLLNIEGTYTSIEEDEGGEYEVTTWKQGLFFANTKTERLFELPGSHGAKMWDAVRSISNSDYVDVKEDKDGMIYMQLGLAQIIKLDTRSYTLSYELPDNQDVREFEVTSDGFIFYYYNSEFKVKCPGGKIVPLNGHGFICNDGIYTLEGKNIYQWKTVGNNNLDKVFICEYDYEYNIYNVIENHVKNTVVLYTGSNCFEFDGINTPILIEDFPEQFEQFHGNDEFDKNRAITKNALYMFEEGKLHRLDLTTYQASVVPTPDSEIQVITSDKSTAGFSFTGIRYADSKNIIGSLSATGEVKTELSFDNGVKAVNLIEIF